jgi:hypothetical protein
LHTCPWHSGAASITRWRHGARSRVRVDGVIQRPFKHSLVQRGLKIIRDDLHAPRCA